jgi:hypothetical protein
MLSVADRRSACWSLLSDELRLVVRPVQSYRDLVAQPAEGGWSLALRRPLKWLIIAVCFLSFTAAGRLVWFHLALAPLVWWLVVAAQAALVAIFGRLLRGRLPWSRLVDLYFAGQGPWYLLLLTGAGICLLSPRVLETWRWLSDRGVVLGLVGLAALWSLVIVTAFFRVAFDRSWRWALGVTCCFFASYGAAIAAYHLALDQIQPLLWSG